MGIWRYNLLLAQPQITLHHHHSGTKIQCLLRVIMPIMRKTVQAEKHRARYHLPRVSTDMPNINIRQRCVYFNVIE
ncbi:hypothetical protein SDC9_187971 [bioreactor metagenome]|uniref:Uncharacterized protein n=1 Tax=bioreactor metagenome TaxID=1076179 RepID=A0A645HW78_9ZZZZ